MAPAGFSLDDAISFGVDEFKKNKGFLIVLVLITESVDLSSDISKAFIEGYNPLLGIAVAVGAWFVATLLELGKIKISLDFCDGIPAKLSDLFMCAPLLVKFILATIVYMIISMIGFLLLVIPGIYWALRFQFYGYFIVEKDVGPIEALRLSYEITGGQAWSLFVFAIVCFLINLLGFICLVIGLLVSIPITMLAHAYVYRELLDRKSLFGYSGHARNSGGYSDYRPQESGLDADS
ncbi:MAG: hypothetical protein E3J72_14790 [Planctomycetota bacterium]|nr:MAG: hypothetical protein E3J72_14790 [Planctomycetota bacterium]